MSTVEYRTGDLFSQPDVKSLGHGVNLIGVMGAGIAPQFKRRWPSMFDAYRNACIDKTLKLGDVMPWPLPGGAVIYNLASQRRPGPDATLDAIAKALRSTLEHAHLNFIDAVAIPRIGAGKGGLRWADVDDCITEVAATSTVKLVVVSLPGA